MSESAPAVISQSQQSLKRYKSVRQAQKQPDESFVSPSVQRQSPPTQNVGVQRSMSRYKGRSRAATGGAQEQYQNPPTMPHIPAVYASTQQMTMAGSTAAVGTNARNFSRLKRDTSAPPTGDSAQKASTRARAGTDGGGRRQTSMPPRSSAARGALQSPPRMHRQLTDSSNGYSHQSAFVRAGPPAFNPYQQGQLYAIPQPPLEPTSEQKWTDTTALPDLQNEHNRKIKERQRLEKESKRREAEEVERQAEEARQAEIEAERKAREDAVLKAEEQRLVEQKVKDAKKQFAERKKSIRPPTSRRLFSRSDHDQPGIPTRSSVDQYSQASSGRQEVLAPAAPDSDLPVRQVNAAVVARPYQSPPKVRKESISKPVSQPSANAVSPPNTRQSAEIAAKPTFFDAPRSAINSGEHSVIVTCRESNTILTVNNDTTVESLIRAAASEMPHERISPDTAILLESFASQGVERRLRRYEHVRDILNSWDSDRQNKLLIVPSVTMGKDENDLFASSVPRREPVETLSLRMHHSSRPGHWDKRVVSLRPGGQVFVAKDEAGKDGRIVCTLSDFDIYIPTALQTKRIRSPKKICFAIKSQGRPSMFITGENFVHWFSTKDRLVADQWYVAIQAWRSWYLVEKMGMGKNTKLEPEVNAGFLGNVGGIGELAAASKVQTAQQGANPGLSLGDDIFKSLSGNRKDRDDNNLFSKEALGYDLGGLINRIGKNEFSTDVTQPNSLARSSTQKRPSQAQNSRSGPPSSFPQTLMSRLEVNEEPTFAPSGLLGRTYSQRQKAIQEGRISLDAGRGDTDWGKPLVDFGGGPYTNNAQPTAQHGRKFSFANGDGPLIGRAGNFNE